MEHAAHNEFGSPCQIASHNSMSCKNKERTLNPFFSQNATRMGSVSNETSWPKWVPNYWLCWLWIDSSSAWERRHISVDTYLVYLHLRGIVASKDVQGFWTQKIGSMVKPGYLLLCSMAGSVVFFCEGMIRNDLCLFSMK